MKKALAIVLSMLLIIAFSATAFASTATEEWSEGATVEGNKIIVSDQQLGGAFSYQFRGDQITSEVQSYQLIVELSKDYQTGELFYTSLGFGTDADTYSTEFSVATLKTADGFLLTSGVAPGQSILIEEPGIYTYQWNVSKTAGVVETEFVIPELTGNNALTFDYAGYQAALDSSNCVRYIWTFGRQVNDDYKLDRDLVLYTAKPVVHSVSVVDGTDGYTPVEIPEIGQKLTANVTLTDGTVIGSYPVDQHLTYEWSYEGSDTVLGTEPVYTVTEDNAGKKLVVRVSGVEGYTGDDVWTAAGVVAEEITDPSEPTDPIDPSDPDNPNEPEDPTVNPSDNQNPDDTTNSGDGDQNGTTSGTDEETGSDVPKMGDVSDMLPWMAVMLLAAAGSAVVILKKRESR